MRRPQETRHPRGYSLLEIIVAMAIFGMFLFMVTALTMSLRRSEKKWPVNYMRHPQVMTVLARLRRDVVDATPPYYPSAIGPFEQTPQTFLVSVLERGGTMRSVVWDFSIRGEVHRRQFLGDRQTSEWVARGVPAHFVIGAMSPLEFASDPEVVRVRAVDDDGRFAIDQLMRPRTNRSSEEPLGATGPPADVPGPTDAFPGDPSFPALPNPPADPPPGMPPTETAPPNAVPPGHEPLQDGRS